MESKNELQTNKKGNGSIIVIIILILLVLALSGYICYDKFLSKEDNTKVTNNDSNAKETDVTSNEENNTVAENDVTTNEENDLNTNEENDTKKYVNKIYANANTKHNIVLFNDGKCVITSSMDYTAKCNYYIEDNKIYLTRSNVGASRYDNKTNEVYKIFNDENNNEHIINENSTDENSALKYLK